MSASLIIFLLLYGFGNQRNGLFNWESTAKPMSNLKTDDGGLTAVILAGGKGTRLKPYTTIIPKPLVPVGERAILEILLLQLKKQNIRNIYICLNHHAEIIKAYFGSGEKIGVTISYIH